MQSPLHVGHFIDVFFLLNLNIYRAEPESTGKMEFLCANFLNTLCQIYAKRTRLIDSKQFEKLEIYIVYFYSFKKFMQHEKYTERKHIDAVFLEKRFIYERIQG